MRFLSRSQAATAAKRVTAPGEGFYTFDMPGANSTPSGRIWKYLTHRHPSPEAELWAKSRDYVSHVEVAPVDGFRTSEVVPVLVITCTLEEVPTADRAEVKELGYRFEPITPSLFQPEVEERKPGASTQRERSSVQSPTKLVWEIADSMPGAARDQVITACMERGVHKSTASTQFYRWQKSKSV